MFSCEYCEIFKKTYFEDISKRLLLAIATVHFLYDSWKLHLYHGLNNNFTGLEIITNGSSAYVLITHGKRFVT